MSKLKVMIACFRAFIHNVYYCDQGYVESQEHGITTLVRCAGCGFEFYRIKPSPSVKETK